MEVLKRQQPDGSNKQYYCQFKGKELTIDVTEFSIKHRNFVLNSVLIFKAKLLYNDWFSHVRACINYPNYKLRVNLSENKLIKIKNETLTMLDKLNPNDLLEFNCIIVTEKIVPLMLAAVFTDSKLEKDLKNFIKSVEKMQEFQTVGG